MEIKKGGSLFILVFLLLIGISFISAENTTQIEKAYSCLSEKVSERTCEALSSEERIFSLLASGGCESEVLADSVNNECWPADGCTIKATAQAILALEGAGSSTDAAQEWLLSQKTNPNDLVWYIQADSDSSASCSVTYDSHAYSFNINEDRTLSATNLGSCLDVSSNSYWLKISSANQLECYGKSFEISCDSDFLTNLLFTKSGSSTISVTPGTSTASAEGATIEKVDSFCFSTGFSCIYEHSLWATYALDKTGNDVSAFLPYLIALKGENDRYLPQAFLLALTEQPSYETSLLAKQKPSSQGYYWSETGNKFYDTALALLPFQGRDLAAKDRTKEWLLKEDVQGENGCWEENIRNTAFLLYSIWPEYSGETSPGTGPGTGPGNTSDCIDSGYFCRSSTSCIQDEGSILDGYSCAYPSICCSTAPGGDEYCFDLGGEICDYDRECVGGVTEETLDLLSGETCCIGGTCELPPGEPREDYCEDFGGVCRTFSCSEGEQESSSYICEGGGICCIEDFNTQSDKSNKWFIWVLVVLIVLTVVAIIFRDKLRRILLRFKSGRGGKGRGSKGPPRAGSSGPPRFFRPVKSSARKRSSKPGPKPKLRSQKELDDVLKKLKEMGK